MSGSCVSGNIVISALNSVRDANGTFQSFPDSLSRVNAHLKVPTLGPDFKWKGETIFLS